MSRPCLTPPTGWRRAGSRHHDRRALARPSDRRGSSPSPRAKPTLVAGRDAWCARIGSPSCPTAIDLEAPPAGPDLRDCSASRAGARSSARMSSRSADRRHRRRPAGVDPSSMSTPTLHVIVIGDGPRARRPRRRRRPPPLPPHPGARARRASGRSARRVRPHVALRGLPVLAARGDAGRHATRADQRRRQPDVVRPGSTASSCQDDDRRHGPTSSSCWPDPERLDTMGAAPPAKAWPGSMCGRMAAGLSAIYDDRGPRELSALIARRGRRRTRRPSCASREAVAPPATPADPRAP